MHFLKSFFKNIGILLGVMLVLGLINRWYLGGFSKLEAKEQNMGPYIVAYIPFTGDYSKVGPLMDKVFQALSGENIISTVGIGIYYTNPMAAGGVELKSDIGAVVDAKDTAKLDKKSAIYKVKNLPAGSKVVVEFPYKNSASYMMASIKVYPVINTYMKDKGYKLDTPIIEIYDMTAKKIYFIADILK